MKKLIIVAAALFAMSAFAADSGTTDKPADTNTMGKEAPAATTAKPKKAHKGDHKAKADKKAADKPADAQPTGDAK